MKRRSEPRPGCTYCRGAGIISVSKEPDEIVDCVCTDIVGEPTPSAARDALVLTVMEVVERWADLLPTPELSGYIADYLIREGYRREEPINV